VAVKTGVLVSTGVKVFENVKEGIFVLTGIGVKLPEVGVSVYVSDIVNVFVSI
jgi:hypothetical protein